jgi:hypothetical protein
MTSPDHRAFWREVARRDSERPMAPDGKVAVDPEHEDSAVIPDPNAHRALPDPEEEE